jgi:hypothetical protein
MEGKGLHLTTRPVAPRRRGRSSMDPVCEVYSTHSIMQLRVVHASSVRSKVHVYDRCLRWQKMYGLAFSPLLM